MNVDVFADDDVDPTLAEAAGDVGAVASRALVAVDLGAAELSVRLCGDAAIHALNLAWRGKDKATDVLSFEQGARPGMGAVHVGDIVISLPTAARQAAERGHSLAAEVRVLVVHGVCHLIGHDHEDDAEAEVMEALERAILARDAEERRVLGAG